VTGVLEVLAAETAAGIRGYLLQRRYAYFDGWTLSVLVQVTARCSTSTCHSLLRRMHENCVSDVKNVI